MLRLKSMDLGIAVSPVLAIIFSSAMQADCLLRSIATESFSRVVLLELICAQVCKVVFRYSSKSAYRRS